MPPLHRYFSNPLLTMIGRALRRSPLRDFNCGLRGCRWDAILQLDLTSPGMEFAVEMIVKSTISRLRIAEVPTTLSPDARGRPPHLRSWRDGWRTIRFFLQLSPRPVSLPRPRTRDPQRHCVIDLVLHRHPYRIGDLLVSYSDHDLGADRRRPAIDRVLGLRQVRWRSNGNCCVPIRCTGASARCSIWNAVLSWRADFWPQLWRSHVTRWSIGPIFHSEILTTRRTFESCAPRASSPSSESSWASIVLFT